MNQPSADSIINAMPADDTQFAQQLARWGPDADRSEPVSLAEAEAYCRELAKSHYENFPVVSWLLPKQLHQHFYNVYAYCRWADDLGDEVGDAARSLELLAWWRGELLRIEDRGLRNASEPSTFNPKHAHPVFVALQRTIAEFNIPLEPFTDLISAFEQDQTVLEYDTFDQLHDYCRRSANPVGRIVLHLCRQYGDENVALSDSICTGLQLANFWQDVARDFDIGRVYLPAEDRARFGYTRDDLEGRVTNEAFIELMQFEVDRAREFLVAGLPLVDAMPGRLRIDIDLFARGGLKVLDRIAAIGYRVWDTRPTVKKRDVVGLFLKSLLRSLCPRRRKKPTTPHTRSP